jgi:hypothetical protein
MIRGIRHQHFVLAGRRRVAIKGRLHVCLQHLPEIRQSGEKLRGDLVGLAADVFFGQAPGRMIFQALAHLVFQSA